MPIKKQWHWGFAEFQNKIKEKLMDVPKETRHSIRSLAKSVAEDNKPENPEGNPNQPQNGALLETTCDIKGIQSRITGISETVNTDSADNVSLPPSTPPSSKAESWGEGPAGGGGGGGGRKINGNCIGNSGEPPLPLFPNGNDPHNSSSSSDSSNNPAGRCGLGRLLLLLQADSTIYSTSVQRRSPAQWYEKITSQTKVPKQFKSDPADVRKNIFCYVKSASGYMAYHKLL